MRKWLGILLIGTVAWAADCTRTSTGFQPLSDPYFFSGGLYPAGSNQPPGAHLEAGLRLAAEIRPINGKIVLLSIGMSNTSMEFSAFQQLAQRDPVKNPSVAIVDGARGGWPADRIVASSSDEYWQEVNRRLEAAGATPEQVQVVWMKQADAGPQQKFPDDARQLQSEIELLAQTARGRFFPNLKILYLSSRIYGGYASTALNPEPYAYQSGYAVKWAIEHQIQGASELSYSDGKAPWMAWGPYLWADGTNARFDGLTWACEDFAEDGTHPSDSGRRKVATMLLDFLKSDPTARPWFVRAPAQQPPQPSIRKVVNAAGFGDAIAAGSIATLFGSELAASTEQAPGPPLPIGLGGARVEIGGVPAPLYYASPAQINLVVPAGVGNQVRVIREGVASDVFEARLALEAPGLFSMDGSGKGPAAAQHADGTNIGYTPARTSEVIVLYGTGRGLRDPRMARPEFLPTLSFGEAQATPFYYGPAPGYPGLDQINVQVPSDAPLGGDVPLVLNLGPAASNAVTLAIAAGP